MFVHKIQKSSYQRLLVNDISGAFKIIIQVHYSEKTQDNLEIQKQKQIIINTTVNKARVISRLINEEYLKNSNVNSFVFDLGNLLQNENHKYQIEHIINIFNSLLKSNCDDIVISENHRELFHHIMNILGNGNEMEEQNITSKIIECKYLYNNKLNGIISYIQQMTRDEVDGNNEHLKLTGSGYTYEHPLRNIIRYDKKNIDNYYSIPYNACNPSQEYYVIFNFVNRKVNITGYTIRTPPLIYEYHLLKTWRILGSNDENKWEMIDNKENNNEINNGNRCVYFEINNTGKFYKYIKYEQDGYFLALSAIEFFGYIME
ncbi:hypothetical protein M9Y10_030625 [Tritrichomonas musculus]|uniref:F5/8 type C domain-containing protein n=1 Tax=Tritrichomonas musculus TaxID=1915356 RepID=A0ABR2H3E6_9EUKA